MNRHSTVWVAPSGSANQKALLGPMVITAHLVEKHKFSFLIHNFGSYPVVLALQYSSDSGVTWSACTAVGKTSSPLSDIQVVAKAEKTIEGAFPKGDRFRIVGYGNGGTTDGRIEMIEGDFESNLNDR